MAASILGRFVWHELMTTDTRSAGRFFSRVVGWTLRPWAEDGSYVMFMAGKAGMGGLMAVPGGPTAPAPPMWLTYIATPDVDLTVAKATSLGGTVLKGVTQIPTIGRFAVIRDPQGAVFAAFTPDGPGASPTAPPGLLDFSWHELATTDAPAALEFYRTLFGWQATESMDMGPQGTYQMYGLDGRSMGGIFGKPAEMPGPCAWLAYIRVGDVKKTAVVIKRAGGTIVNGPMQVPGGDWIAQALDPQGVMFAVHSVSAAAKPAARKPKPKPRPKVGAKKPKAAAKKKVVAGKAAVSKAARGSAKPATRKARARTAKPRVMKTVGSKRARGASKSRTARRLRR